MEKILLRRVCFTRAGAGAFEQRVEGRVGRKEESRRESETNSVFFVHSVASPSTAMLTQT